MPKLPLKSLIEFFMQLYNSTFFLLPLKELSKAPSAEPTSDCCPDDSTQVGLIFSLYLLLDNVGLSLYISGRVKLVKKN